MINICCALVAIVWLHLHYVGETLQLFVLSFSHSFIVYKTFNLLVTVEKYLLNIFMFLMHSNKLSLFQHIYSTNENHIYRMYRIYKLHIHCTTIDIAWLYDVDCLRNTAAIVPLSDSSAMSERSTNIIRAPSTFLPPPRRPRPLPWSFQTCTWTCTPSDSISSCWPATRPSTVSWLRWTRAWLCRKRGSANG